MSRLCHWANKIIRMVCTEAPLEVLNEYVESEWFQWFQWGLPSFSVPISLSIKNCLHIYQKYKVLTLFFRSLDSIKKSQNAPCFGLMSLSLKSVVASF